MLGMAGIEATHLSGSGSREAQVSEAQIEFLNAQAAELAKLRLLDFGTWEN